VTTTLGRHEEEVVAVAVGNPYKLPTKITIQVIPTNHTVDDERLLVEGDIFECNNLQVLISSFRAQYAAQMSEGNSIVATSVHLGLSDDVSNMPSQDEWQELCDGIAALPILCLRLSAVQLHGQGHMRNDAIPGIVDSCWSALLRRTSASLKALTIDPLFNFPQTVHTLKSLTHLRSLSLRQSQDGDGFFVHWKVWNDLADILASSSTIQYIEMTKITIVDRSWDMPTVDGACFSVLCKIIDSIEKMKHTRQVVVDNWSVIGKSRGEERNSATGEITSQWMSSCISTFCPSTEDQRKLLNHPIMNNALRHVVDNGNENASTANLFDAILAIHPHSIEQIYQVLHEVGPARYAQMALDDGTCHAVTPIRRKITEERCPRRCLRCIEKAM